MLSRTFSYNTIFPWCLTDVWALRPGIESCERLGNWKKCMEIQAYTTTTSFVPREGCHSDQMLSWQTPVDIKAHIGNTNSHGHTHTSHTEVGTQACKETHTSRLTKVKKRKGEGTGPLSQDHIYIKIHKSGILPDIALLQITSWLILYYLEDGYQYLNINWPSVPYTYLRVSTRFKCLVFSHSKLCFEIITILLIKPSVPYIIC